MKMEEIGFYTLSDDRCKNVSFTSNLERCELILTDRCNFKCSYCRGMTSENKGDISFENAIEIVDKWTSHGLKNIRFSGGEPTIWPNLIELVKHTKSKQSIQHIALSTNGSANSSIYLDLLNAGVNDFSISLDACCAMTADKMAGTNSKFQKICENIKLLSELTYVTVGVVLDERNNSELNNIIEYATSLGVSDIRIIPSAQSNHKLNLDKKSSHKILNYRLNNIKNGVHVRGLTENDTNKCHLVKDDMVVLKNNHYPCVIYMREQGNPIGTVIGKSIEEIRNSRKDWFKNHDSKTDSICSKNCLDVCIEHNNRCEKWKN